MAEPKRLQFTTVDPSNGEEKKKTPQNCHRFTLSLSASTDTTCPEFSYTDLVKIKLKGKKDPDKPRTEEISKSSPFDDDEDPDEIAAIARKFEEKYGHMDLGEGYDETDEFIDNSEAYDEVLPSCLQTKLGGFYINSGKLDFKEVEEDSREEFQSPVKKKKKKRLITSDSESDEEEKKKKVKKRKLKEGVEGEKKKKKHLLNGDTEKAFKKPKKPIDKEKMKKKKMSPTVAELLKQQTESTSNTSALSNGVPNADMETHSPSMIDGNDSSSDAVIANKEDSNSRDMEEDKKATDPAAIPKLPTGLPAELEQTIDKLKEAAKNSSVGKSKFFTTAVNKMLLDVELGCRQLSCGNRSSVYAYLAVYLPCGKETLKTRAKKLRENMETDLLREPMQKLREALDKVLPAMVEKYEAECQKLSQMRSQEKEKEEAKEEREGMEDMDNEEKTNTEANKKKLPPKKFEWNSEIRVLLCDVVRIKLRIYDSSKTRVQGAEEFLKSFLDRDIKSLWPKGWMQTRVLYRESKMAHAPWTMQKPKKTVIITKTTPTAGSAPTTPTSSLISKNVTPSSAVVKTPVSDISLKQDKSTPTLPEAARSNIPTILDYAEKETLRKLSPTTAVSSAKSDTSLTSGSQPNTAASGLSLLAASAAKQQYLERSWDHVVSDILRTSLTKTDGKNLQTTPKTPSAGDAGNSFLAAFEKYASSSSVESKLKNPKVGAENSGSLVAKQLTTQPVPTPQINEPLKLNQNKSASQDVSLQQTKASLLLQTKQLQQKQVMDKLKMVSQQNIENKQTNPNSSSAQPKVVKAFKITPQQQQMIQKVGQSMPKSGQAVISVSTSKGGSQHVSLLNQDHIYKQLLESGVQGLNQFKSPSQISPTSVSKNTQNVPATIILTSNSGKTPQQKVTTVSLTKVTTGNQNSGNSQRTSPGQITSSQISRTSPVSGQRLSQGHNPSPSFSMNSVGSKVIHSSSNGQNRNSGTATNLLQQLFEANTTSHSIPKQMTSSMGMQRSPQKSPQGIPTQSQIWSMSSMATSASSNGKSGGYNMTNVIPKPVPGYQSVRIGNIPKDLVSSGQLQRTSMHAQGTYGGTPTSPISPGQQNPLGNPRMMSGQTSPLRHPAPHEKSRSPHGY